MLTRLCLVVDDEPSIRAYLKVILARKQFQTVQAENGVSGLHIAEELGDALDLIVSDVEMPDGDGLTFVGTVRASYPSIPIIVVSAGAPFEGSSPASSSFAFVPKPFS